MWTSDQPFRNRSRVLSQVPPDATKVLLLDFGAVEQPRLVVQIQFDILPPAFVRLSAHLQQSRPVWKLRVVRWWQEVQQARLSVVQPRHILVRHSSRPRNVSSTVKTRGCPCDKLLIACHAIMKSVGHALHFAFHELFNRYGLQDVKK